MAEYTPGRPAPAGAGGREQRLAAMLAKWPVLAEEWARDVEHRRTHPEAAGGVPAPTGTPANAVDSGITPLQAINRALGLPDDDGIDAVEARRAGRGG
jgi:hypothetical protein